MFWRKKKHNLFALSTNDAVGQRFVRASVEYLVKQQQWEKDVGLGDVSKWFFDQDVGILTLEGINGVTRQFPVQIFGSYLEPKREWEWAWNNSHINSEMAAVSQQLKQFGTDHSIPFLIKGQLHIPDDKTLVFLESICVGLTSAIACYKADAGELLVFLAVMQETLPRCEPSDAKDTQKAARL